MPESPARSAYCIRFKLFTSLRKKVVPNWVGERRETCSMAGKYFTLRYVFKVIQSYHKKNLIRFTRIRADYLF